MRRFLPRCRRTVRLTTILIAAFAGALASVGPVAPQAALAGEASLTFGPDADARVEEAYPSTNFGLRKGLLTDAYPSAKESYLRFTVARVTGTVASAKLRLYVFEGSVDGPAVYATATDWPETGMTWDTRPARGSGPLDDVGAVAVGTWVEFDVTSAVTGNGTHGFALVPTSWDGLDMYSREAAAVGLPTPELVVTFTDAAPPVPDVIPPTVAISSPASGSTYASAQTVTIAASASDDIGVERVEFYENGTLRGSDGSAPFAFDWAFTRPDNGAHSWTAKAYDGAGNSSVSAPVDLTVDIPEPVPPPGDTPDPGDPPGPITATVETDPVPHAGDAADDAAIWVDRSDPAASAIIGTDKLGGLAVYDLSGRELHYYADGRPNNVDLRDRFPLGGERVPLVTASNRANNTILIYKLNPQTRGLENLAARPIATGIGVYGLCMYQSRASGKFYAFVTSTGGTVQQWELFDDGTGKVDAKQVRTFGVGSISEGCVADDELGHLYVGEENVAVWKYGAEPEAGTARTTVDRAAIGGRLVADIEGLAILHGSDGTGYLLASSQGSDSFAVYEREGENAYVGSFAVAAGTLDAVSGTDGIAVDGAGLGSAFPDGVFVAQDNSNGGGNQNFKLVPWERIARALAAGRPDPSSCTRPYSDSSPWNTPIGPAPSYDPSSSFHITALQGALTSDPTQYTYPVYEVSSSTPLQLVTVSGWFSNVLDAGSTLLNQRAGTVLLPIPAGAEPAAGSDRQIVMIDPATGDEWGASNLQRDLLGNWTAWNAYHYNTQWSGVPPRDASGRPFFLRGAGVPYLAGLVRPCEIARGRIDHALAFAYDYPTADYVYPATKSDGNGTEPADMPEGARLQLDPDLTEAQIREWGCAGPCLTIAKALQEYGMYIVDNSGREKVYMEYEGTAHWNGLVTAQTVSPIPLTAFRLLDMTP